MDIEIRAEPLDGPDGQELLTAFEDEIADRYPGWNPSVGPSARPEEFRPPRGLFLVAYVDGRRVGCGGFKCLDEGAVEVKRLYVSHEERGTGLGRRLLQRLEDAARAAGCEVVRLDTGDRQPEALELFRSMGYREIPDYNGNPFASYWFEKRLCETRRRRPVDR